MKLHSLASNYLYKSIENRVQIPSKASISKPFKNIIQDICIYGLKWLLLESKKFNKLIQNAQVRRIRENSRSICVKSKNVTTY